MKHNSFFILLIFVWCLAGCTAEKDYLFEIHNVQNTYIAAGINVLETIYIPLTFPNRKSEEAQANGHTVSEITGIFPGRGTIESLDGTDLNIISDAKILIIDPNTGSKREALFTLEVPTNTNDIVYMNGTLVNLTTMMEDPSYKAELRLQFRENVLFQVPIRLNFSFLAR